MLWIIRDTNLEVTKYYLDILERSATIAGQEVKQVENVNCVKNESKKDIYLVTTLLDAVKVYLSGKRRIFIWFQGAFSEESYMKHKSPIRKFILRRIEKFMLKKAQFIFFVSEEMKRFYTQKFKVNLEGKYYVMPCFNSDINKSAFMTQGKYDNNIFCYAGSLSVWQGFDKVLECYKRIEQLGFKETKLLVLTSEKKKAEELVKKADIKNYCIDYVPLEKLPNTLAKAKFGFIIRDNTIVNRVATPTKISTYMANGLIPIYSDCLIDFHEKSKGVKYTIPFDKEDFISQIKLFMCEEIDAKEIYNEYFKLFDTYYNRDYHANKISEKISMFFNFKDLKYQRSK